MLKKHVWLDANGQLTDPWVQAAPQEVEQIYDEKFRIANLLRPRSLLEIGVRAGYTAAMFLEAGARRYIGLDATDTWGGTVGAVDFARQHLPEAFPEAQVEIHHVDTQTVATLAPYGPVELVHVDGDHSLNGCLHDLELALTVEPSWILVDDILHHPESCRIAAECFATRHRLRHLFLPTRRGDMLFQVERP